MSSDFPWFKIHPKGRIRSSGASASVRCTERKAWETAFARCAATRSPLIGVLPHGNDARRRLLP